MKKRSWSLLLPTLLGACASLDYHGIEPRVYNEALYPKTNKVEESALLQSFAFIPQRAAFSHDTSHDLQAFLDEIYPDSVSALTIRLRAPDRERELYVTRALRKMGFVKRTMHYRYDKGIGRDEVQLHVAYSYVVTPDCPDWRKSSLLNYSNTNMSNQGCTTVTNIGRMVTNPRDLVRSATTRVVPDGVVDAAAINAYRTGAAASSSASGESSGSASQ